MKFIFKNLNWLFILIAAGPLIIGFFGLPPFLLVMNVGLVISLIILVLYTSATSIKSNEKLSSEESRLRTIVGNLSDGIVAYDQNYMILTFNPAAEQIFNLKAEEVVGQSFTLKVKQDSTRRFKTLLTILFPALAQMIVRRSDPGVFPQIVDISFDDPPLELKVVTNKIMDWKGAVVGFVKIIHDRTRELTLLQSKSEFITIASHQLRTPLSGLNWALSTLKNEALPQEQKSLIFNGISAVNRLLKVVDDLLDVAKIEEGKFGYQFQETDMSSFLEDALIQSKPAATQYNVRLYFERPKDDIPKAYCDPQKIGIVVANLIDNGIKYNVPNGEVIVKLEKLPNIPYLSISIRDTGIGIPPEYMNKIFTRFFRGENAVKVAVEGSGLGLYIAKNIIRRHGGEIKVESTPNRGSKFTFTLPTNQTLVPAREIIYEDE